MLDTVILVGHRLGRRYQYRHIFGTASRHHAVDRDAPDRGLAVIGQHHADHFIGRALRELQEFAHLFNRRRYDRKSVAPFVLVEEAVYFLEGAGEDDIFGRRLGFGITVAVGLFGQPLDDGLDSDIDDIAPKFLGALNIGMAGDDRELHVG